MGVYKRGDTWGISYFHNGKRIRKTIGTDKGEWRGHGGENLFNLPKGPEDLLAILIMKLYI